MEVRAHVRRLLASVPRLLLLRVLTDILRPLPPDVRHFLERSLERRDHYRSGRFRLLNDTPDQSAALRHLELLCKSRNDVGPKQLFDNLLLVFITFKSLVFQLPPGTAAAQVGISSKDLYRLRRRVLRANSSAASLEPRAQFEYALMALARACQAPEHSAEQVLQHLTREHLA